MNLMFWKKPPPADESAEDPPEKPGGRTASRKPPGHESSDQDMPGDTRREAADTGPVHSKQRLIIAATLIVLVLAAFGTATWKIFLHSPSQDNATVGTSASIQPAILPEKNLIKLPRVEFLQTKKEPAKDPQADIEVLRSRNEALRVQIESLKIAPAQVEDPVGASRQADIETLKKDNERLQAQIEALKAELSQIERAQAEQNRADIDALKKKNNELQAQIDALKKMQLQRPSTSPASRPAGKIRPPTPSSEVDIGSKSPKAAAMTLKEAIEAMNTGAGQPPSKTAE